MIIALLRIDHFSPPSDLVTIFLLLTSIFYLQASIFYLPASNFELRTTISELLISPNSSYLYDRLPFHVRAVSQRALVFLQASYLVALDILV